MDNRIFNVNGSGKKKLLLALSLLMDDWAIATISHFSISKEKGFILHSWKTENTRPFLNLMGDPQPLDLPDLVDVLDKWLKSPEALETKMEGWDEDIDCDGSTELGWRVYVEDWGHIKNSEHTIDHSTIAAIKPVYLWYGK